jgi:hypothetical protein
MGRKLKAKPNEIVVGYSKKERDFIVNWGEKIGRGSPCFVIDHLCGKLPFYDFQKCSYKMKVFVKELEELGFDSKTMKFSIMKKESGE